MLKPNLYEAIDQFKIREQQLLRMFDAATMNSDYYLQWKLNALSNIQQSFGRDPLWKQEVALKLLRIELRAIEKKRYPNLVERQLRRGIRQLRHYFSPESRQERKEKSVAARQAKEKFEQVITQMDAPQPGQQQAQSLITKNTWDMNETNLNALKDNLKNLGFGEDLQPQLESSIRAQQPEFTLQKEIVYNKQAMQTELSFRKGEQNEMYFFNKYDARLTETPDRQQTFYIDRGRGVTTKEAFNLLEGRAVNKNLLNKEGEPYNAWLQLDLSQKDEKGNFKLNRYTTNYGYNLENAVSRYPLKELLEPQTKADLLQSLQKGNRQSVTMEKEGSDTRFYLEANPKMKTVNVYDQQGQPLSKEQRTEFQINTSVQDKVQQTSATPLDEGDGPELKKKRTQTKGIKI